MGSLCGVHGVWLVGKISLLTILVVFVVQSFGDFSQADCWWQLLHSCVVVFKLGTVDDGGMWIKVVVGDKEDCIVG